MKGSERCLIGCFFIIINEGDFNHCPHGNLMIFEKIGWV
jgi:hypothetical protein